MKPHKNHSAKPLKPSSHHKRQAILPTPKSVPPTPANSKFLHFNIQWKYVFLIIFLAIGLLLALATPQQGIIGDEEIDGTNGYGALLYYTKGDTSFANYSASNIKAPSIQEPISSHLRYYGVAFDILPSIAVSLGMPYKYTYDFRHSIMALLGWLLILFCGLITRQLSNWCAACIALVIIFLTPMIFGWTFTAYKDIPMAAGFAAATYAFIKIYKSLSAIPTKQPNLWQRIHPRDAILATIAIAWSLGVRIGGLLLPFYFATGLVLLFFMNRNFRTTIKHNKIFTLKFIGISAAICIAGIMLGLCCYPNFIYEGFAHVKSAMGMVSKFYAEIPMLWEGRQINSMDLPPNYLLKSYLFTIPLWVFAGAALFIINLRRFTKTTPFFFTIFISFTLLFPVIYILALNSQVYNGWRHTSFIYASLAALSAIGFHQTSKWFKQNNIWKSILTIALAAAIFPTAKWLAQNYRYASSYYNALIKNPYAKYDLDPGEVGVVNGLKWLIDTKLTDTTQHYRVGVKNMNGKVYTYVKGITHVETIWKGARAFASTDCDYAVLSLQFLPAKVIKSFFPPKGTIRVEKVDGMPVACVVEKNPDDALGIKLVQNNKFNEAVSVLERAYNYNPANFGLWYYMGIAYYYTGKYDRAIAFFTKVVEYWPTKEELASSFAHIGAAQVEQKNYDDGIRNLKEGQKYNAGKDAGIDAFINANAGLAYYHKNDYTQAATYLEKSVPHYPHLRALLEFCKAKTK